MPSSIRAPCSFVRAYVVIYRSVGRQTTLRARSAALRGVEIVRISCRRRRRQRRRRMDRYVRHSQRRCLTARSATFFVDLNAVFYLYFYWGPRETLRR